MPAERLLLLEEAGTDRSAGAQSALCSSIAIASARFDGPNPIPIRSSVSSDPSEFSLAVR